MSLLSWGEGLLGFTACPVSFPPSSGDPKSGWDLDPNKLGCTKSCGGDETDPNFSHSFFWIFFPRSLAFSTNPRVVESIIGLAPVEHPH